MYRHQGMAVVTVSCEAPGDFDGTATRCCNGTLLIGEGNAPLATGSPDAHGRPIDHRSSSRGLASERGRTHGRPPWSGDDVTSRPVQLVPLDLGQHDVRALS